jgi:uncharacterized protein YkwD
MVRTALNARTLMLNAAAAIAIAAAAMLFVPARPAAAPGACASAGADRPLGALSSYELRTAMICLINDYRSSRGLHTLVQRLRLFRAARYHNADMQRHIHHLAHNSSNGESSTQRIRRFGYTSGANYWRVGEVIGERWGNGATARAVLDDWTASRIHGPILRKARWRDFGVAGRHGTAENANAHGALFTVDFGRRKPSL